MNRTRIVTLAIALVTALLVAGCAAPGAETSATKKITLAIQPTDSIAAIQEQKASLELFLEQGMAARGVVADVDIVVPMGYLGVVEALRYGWADAAMMSSWPAVVANEKAGAEIVLAEMREVVVDGEQTVAPAYYSYYVVMPDSPYQTLADLAGARVAFTSGSSTSGYIAPVAKLIDEGLLAAAADGVAADPSLFFGEVVFAGGYRQAWEALKNGQVDVAVTAGDIPYDLFNEVITSTRTIAQQGPLPSHGVVFAKDFTGPEADALKAAFLDLKDDKRDIMRKLVSGIFVEFAETTTAEHVAPLQEALRVTGIRFGETLK